MGTKSGMRYNATMKLIKDIEDYKDKIVDTIQTAADREADIAKVYGGEAAQQYRQSLQTEADNIKTTLEKIVKDLTAEAEDTKQKYEEQERRLAEASPKTE